MVNIIIRSLEDIALLQQLYEHEEVSVIVFSDLSFSYILEHDKFIFAKSSITFILKKNVHISLQSFCTTVKDISYKIILEGQSAHFSLVMRLELFENVICSVSTEQLHSAPDTGSFLSIKAALHKGSFYDYKGIIILPKSSVNAQASLSNKVLLLDKTAQARSIPSLQIDHSKVVCSHGTAIDYIQDLFLYPIYMRGISYSDACALYKQGFLLTID